MTSSNNGGADFSPVTAVNDDHGILPPMSLLQGSNGSLGVSYLDERYPGYQIYFNRSLDNGLTWERPDQRLDAASATGSSTSVYEPQTVISGDAWVSIWADVVRGQGHTKYRVLSRRSVDGGKSWQAEQVLYTTSHQPTSLVARAAGSNLVVAADEVSRGVFALVSKDRGLNWSDPVFVDGTTDDINSGLALALTNNKANVVWMRDRKSEKTRIMRAHLDIAQSQWTGQAQRLDIKAHENTQSISPVLITTRDGVVLSAWVDYRDIRPNIYISLSRDGGVVWSVPQAVLKTGEVAAGWPQLISWGDGAAIGYERYPTDRHAEGVFELRRIDVNNNSLAISNLPESSIVSEGAKRIKLEQRVRTLWAHRVAGEYDQAYEMFDFAYRATTPKKFYLENIGVITYLDYLVDSIAVTGNEADVKMKLKYEVKPMILPMTGKPISVPPVDTELASKWVWVGDDWYLVYAPSFDPPVLKY
jgi:hypothetical protein